MDLSKVPNEEKLYLCKTYFKVGFALLPFAWLVNTIWFFSDAFLKPEFDQQKQIKKYVIYSAIGTLASSILIAAWIITYQKNRDDWDSLAFIIPEGDSRQY